MQKYQQHRDKHQGLTAYLVGLGEQRLAQWWRNFEDIRQAGFYGNQAGESEVQEALALLECICTWATTEKGGFMKRASIPARLDRRRLLWSETP